MGSDPVSHHSFLYYHLLDLVVRRQLRRGDDHCSVHRERRPAPQAADAFLFRHLTQCIDYTFIVPSLVDGKTPIGLHSHHRHVGRVANGCANAAGDKTSQYLAGKRQIPCFIIRPFVLENIVKSHTRSGIQRLAEYGGGNPGEKRRNTFRLDDTDTDGNRTNTRLRNSLRDRNIPDGGGVHGERRTENLNRRIGEMGFSLKLHTDLDEVQRMGGSAGDDRRNASLHETFQTHDSISIAESFSDQKI
ncbi:hypothetical protein GQ457_04G003590 [Hibiscus cannabinus]